MNIPEHRMTSTEIGGVTIRTPKPNAVYFTDAVGEVRMFSNNSPRFVLKDRTSKHSMLCYDEPPYFRLNSQLMGISIGVPYREIAAAIRERRPMRWTLAPATLAGGDLDAWDLAREPLILDLAHKDETVSFACSRYSIAPAITSLSAHLLAAAILPAPPAQWEGIGLEIRRAAGDSTAFDSPLSAREALAVHALCKPLFRNQRA